MSPVFRHGRLRLYLLKLLDESPRHGYEVIRLLQDRFLGVYAPSPGTIYPRLARLEEEGLVTHDVTDGKKVYRITEKGREELRARLDDLNELEEEITASVRDIAREVSEDVRETVRSLREELTWAAREIHSRARQSAAGAAQPWAGEEGDRGGHKDDIRDEDRGRPGESHGRRQTGLDEDRDPAPAGPGDERDRRSGRAAGRDRRAEDDDRRERAGTGWQHDDWYRGDWYRGERHRGERHSEGRGGRPWGDKDWGDWTGWAGWGSWGAHQHPDPRGFRDFERLAKQFSRELRAAAWHAQAVSEDAVRDLRSILEETIDKIKSEVFKSAAAPPEPGASHEPPAPGEPADPANGTSTAPAE
jgi:DNA-binding PadR family transcriptional regulator